MKRPFLLSLVFVSAASLILPTSALSATPCCDVTAVDVVRGLIAVRDIKSGQTVQFKATGAELRNIKIGDSADVNFQSGMITSVAGVNRSYAALQLDTATPCCGVVSIQPDPAVPCCDVVTGANKITGDTFQFSADRQVAASLRVGSSFSLDASGNYAVVQSASTAGNSIVYTYPVTLGSPGKASGQPSGKSGSASTIGSASQQTQWELTPNPQLKGRTGRIVVAVPGQASVIFQVIRPSDGKQLLSLYDTGSGSFMPGEYEVRIWDARLPAVPVQAGMDTRVKVGVLAVNLEGTYNVSDSASGQNVFSGHANEKPKIVLPVGTYKIKMPTSEDSITVKDGEVTSF